MKKAWVLLTLACALAGTGWWWLQKNEPAGVVLCNACPPGFELSADNRCLLRTLYQQYESVSGHDPGVGGLKSALPPVRDGFTPQQIDLGRYLFFDPVLSGNKSMSCATCHQPDKGFGDGLRTSKGMGGTMLKRAAPSLWNVAFLKKLFWDARAGSLEDQMQGPLYAADEMANSRENLLQTLNGIDQYRKLFRQAFPQDPSDGIAANQVYTSLAAFESSLISLNSRYDQYAHGYAAALNQREIEGLNVFRSFVARCAECHTPPLFTNQQIAVIGLAEPDGSFDAGAEKTFHDSTMRGGFKVPGLRNIALTAPYSHSGRFASLKEAVRFYTLGRGHEVPKGVNLRLHWHIWEPRLSEYEMDRVVDFLATLTDEGFKPKKPEQSVSGF